MFFIEFTYVHPQTHKIMRTKVLDGPFACVLEDLSTRDIIAFKSWIRCSDKPNSKVINQGKTIAYRTFINEEVVLILPSGSDTYNRYYVIAYPTESDVAKEPKRRTVIMEKLDG